MTILKFYSVALITILLFMSGVQAFEDSNKRISIVSFLMLVPVLIVLLTK